MKNPATLIAAILACSTLLKAETIPGYVVYWGYDLQSRSSSNLVTQTGPVVDVAAVSTQNRGVMALKNDGVVVGWRTDGKSQATGIPDNLNQVVAVSGGCEEGLALKKNGAIVAWGNNQFDRTAVPLFLTNISAIASGPGTCFALTRDGAVSAWGNTKPPEGLSNVVAISASQKWTGDNLALEKDGRIAEWNNRNHAIDMVQGVSNAMAIAAGGTHSLALRNDGTVFGWGANESGEITIPRGLNGIVAIAAGGYTGSGSYGYAYSMALKQNGEIVTWGKIGNHSVTVPVGLSNVVAIVAGETYCLAITTNRAVAEKFRPKQQSFGQNN